MNTFGKKLSSNKAITIHSLTAGVAYLICAAMAVINFSQKSALLLVFFFIPTIICGSAVMLIKQMRQWRDNENYRAIGIMAVINLIIVIISLFFAVDIIINFI